MIPQSAFPGAKRQVMLHAIAGEDLGTPLIHSDGDTDDQATLCQAQPLMLPGIEPQSLGRQVELTHGHTVGL